MTCNHVAPGVIICTTPSTRYRKMIDCPVCKTRRRATRTFGGWYGDDVSCCGCGNVWSDDHRMTRFRTAKAKAKAIALARERWRMARPAAEYRDAMDQFIDTYHNDPDDDPDDDGCDIDGRTGFCRRDHECPEPDLDGEDLFPARPVSHRDRLTDLALEASRD